MRRFAIDLLSGAALSIPLWCAGAHATMASPWLDGERPSAQARQAVELLSDAASHGLEPEDYDASPLRRALSRASQGAQADDADAARLAQSLTAAMRHYLADLHDGRVDPRSVHHNFEPPQRRGFDAAAVLDAALAAHRLPQAVQEATPQVPLYGHLREALARYRALGDHPAWRRPLPPLPAASRGRAAKLEPGQAYAGLAVLAQRLIALGDLPPQAVQPARYEGALVTAVAAFQERHGLAPDGVLGRATLAQLEVPPAARARQIELALERLRWTPFMQGPRMIVVNIPEFVLRAYEVRDGRIHVRQEMKVIVGKAMDTRTPLFSEEMRFIEFSPYWNVPLSIARNEIVPRLRRDPGYFTREGFEFVTSDGRVDASLSAAQLEAVLGGQARIRQRPGPANALGDIKFVFPNRDNIYLHHTPATSLFARDRRDFSHGCIRVEQPVALADFVLEGMPQWDEARIREAMGQGQSMTLRLAQPVPVLIAYGTTLVKGGRTYFFDDLYGHDRLLDIALREHERQRRPLIDRP
ncbi:MAG TPA: L,D-transpeptidase family protein [Albitalea sp.]|nr:L,D-transpeptidase family protein [Albitalea sp.]